jgi:hypothetical protein
MCILTPIGDPFAFRTFPTIELTDNVGNTANQTDYTFTSRAIGNVSGHWRRVIIAVYATASAGAEPTSMTKGGSAMTRLVGGVATSGTLASTIYYLEDNSAATTATFVASGTTGASSAYLSVYALYDSHFPSDQSINLVTQFVGQFTSGTTCNITSAISTDMVGVARFYTAAGTVTSDHTWSAGFTEQFDVNVEATSRHSDGLWLRNPLIAPGALAQSVQSTGGSPGNGIVSAAFFK